MTTPAPLVVEASAGPFCAVCSAREPHAIDVCLNVLRKSLADERAFARNLAAQLAEVTAEREEARADHDDALRQIIHHVQSCARLEKDRDTARAEVERMRAATRTAVRLFSADTDLGASQCDRVAALAESIGERIQRWALFFNGTQQIGYDYFLSEAAARREAERHGDPERYDVRIALTSRGEEG